MTSGKLPQRGAESAKGYKIEKAGDRGGQLGDGNERGVVLRRKNRRLLRRGKFKCGAISRRSAPICIKSHGADEAGIYGKRKTEKDDLLFRLSDGLVPTARRGKTQGGGRFFFGKIRPHGKN